LGWIAEQILNRFEVDRNIEKSGLLYQAVLSETIIQLLLLSENSTYGQFLHKAIEVDEDFDKV